MKISRINAVWCSGCLVMKKVWKEIMALYPNLEIINYDYDIDIEEVQKYQVGQVLPVAIFLKNGQEKRLIGEQTKEEIIKTIESM